MDRRIEQRISDDYFAISYRLAKLLKKQINTSFFIVDYALSGDEPIVACWQFEGPPDANLFRPVNQDLSGGNQERNRNHSLYDSLGWNGPRR